ncbi:caldesmon-like [Cynara cardunculus var. scolymus]|uniref:caldesmon-like n=1 Tax=Cynara cardunculus var. scolymus TaxID=59895 RepID=UPI000D62E5A8|nr:caldesmon-like [Cynara cardunculus var. scolymus]
MKSKEIRRSYRRIHKTLEPVSRTPLRIGTVEEEERTEDTSRLQAEGETVKVGEEKMRAEEERVRVEQKRAKERKIEEARKKGAEREKKKKEEVARAEQERLAKLARARAEAEQAEKARQAEITRLSEEAKLIVEEEARQTLAHSSSPNQGLTMSTTMMLHGIIQVKKSAMNALGDRLLQKVADFTTDFNSKATKAAKDINDTLLRFNYRLDDEMRKVGVEVDELLKTIKETIKTMPRAEDQRDLSPCAEPSKRRRLDDDEEPDESGPQNFQ